jgi:preprotein translocase subunit SecE
MKTASMEHTKDTPDKRESGGGLLAKPGEWWANTRTFLTEVRAEVKRVTWPSRNEVYATTVVVILTSIFFGVYLYGIDLLFSSIVSWFFRVMGAA